MKPIAGFPGFWVTESGEVYSDRASVPVGRRGSISVIDSKRRHVLGPRLCGKYFSVQLSDLTGKQSNRYVHRLVLEAFVGPAPKGFEARHLDGDRGNNKLSNLAWGSRSENAADRRRHGTLMQGRSCWAARLDADAVRRMRDAYLEGKTYRSIADEHGVHVVTARDAIVGRTWKHVAGAIGITPKAIKAGGGVDRRDAKESA